MEYGRWKYVVYDIFGWFIFKNDYYILLLEIFICSLNKKEKNCYVLFNEII